MLGLSTRHSVSHSQSCSSPSLPPCPSSSTPTSPRPMSAATAPLALALSTHHDYPPLSLPRSPYADRPSFAMTQPEPARSVSPDAEGVDLSQIPEDIIDHTVFGQILELDEEGDEEFSYEMVSAYFKQALQTFQEMEAALCVVPQHLSPVY